MSDTKEGEVYVNKINAKRIRFISYWNEWAVYYRDLSTCCNCLMAKDKFFSNYEKEELR